MTRPNIIFIVLDTLRADKVLNEERMNLTPNLKKILTHSYYFENGTSNSTWTLPSHNSMFTGLSTSQIKKLGGKLHYINENLPLLAEILKDEGYYTLCFTENPWINEFFRNTRGFKSYIKNFRRSFFILENNKISKLIENFFEFSDNIFKNWIKNKLIIFYSEFFEKIIKKITKELLYKLSWENWVFEYKNTLVKLDKLKYKLNRRLGKRPFFLFFNIMATHAPYIPPRSVLKKFGIDHNNLKIIKDFLLKPTHYFRNINYQFSKLTKNQIETLNSLYNASVYYSDQITQKIFENFENLGNSTDSYIIITSDHGEHLCSKKDHFLYGHGISYSVYDDLIRVPIIIYNKKFSKTLIKNPAQLKDIFHTILNIAEIRRDLPVYNPSKSILNQITNNNYEKYIYGEHLKRKDEMRALIRNNKRYLTDSIIKKIYNEIYYIRSKDYKYVNYGNKLEELYDLQKDPQENDNIIDKNHEIHSEMKKAMMKARKELTNIDSIIDFITKKEKSNIIKVIGDLKI
ncbi:MAG: sulfatase-like hydrolase/transferase [Promethearchaeia archaeon]